ncbi:hypothetical protein EG329_012913 [Mollisiaceae sp. DMI_Dod_QoI]|nr:hypothetical protein EG329_012913 [Helotiales sp. DMI_Dod_QoI]
MDPSSAFGGSWTAVGFDNEEASWPIAGDLEDDFLPSMDSPFAGFTNIRSVENLSSPDNFHHHLSAQYASPESPFRSEILSSPDSFHHYLSTQYTSPRSPFISGHFMPLPNSLTLSTRAHHALGHYQTTFSIYRTTKDPKWSTHKLLLDLGAKSTMIMQFILAVAINDVCHRQQHEGSFEAQEYFEAGARELIETIKKDSEEDFVVAMAGFLFLYWYMPKRKSVPRERIQQLSMTVLTYLKRHKLDSRCLESEVESSAGETSSGLSDRDRPVLARLIIWTFDEDVKCGFQGSGGYLAAYLTAHRERTMAVYEVSRTALNAYWGTEYPEAQTSDDDDNAMELEFLWALTALWQDINELSQSQSLPHSEAHRRIAQRFSLLEKKYSSVFQKSAITTKPRNRVLINADYDIILFHALRVYYFRTTTVDSNTAEIPPDVQMALKHMLDIIKRTFASKSRASNDLHDRLQWPFFLAGIETDDGIYRDWIVSNITNQRAKEALQKTIDHQSCSGKRLAMSVIKALLCESELVSSYPLSEENSFLETIIERDF